MLSQSQRTTILELNASGVSRREIARVLRVSRLSVRKVLRSNSASVPEIHRAEKAEPYEKCEHDLAEAAAHRSPPVGAKARKRRSASLNNSSVIVRYTAVEFGST